jgi:hypothetical protein
MADSELDELIRLYRLYEESPPNESEAALASFEEACKAQAVSKSIDSTKLIAFARKRYYQQVSTENRRVRRPD